MKKYKLRLDLSIDKEGVKLYRIERLKDGALGGYIEKEGNLSHEGDAWVYGDAKVYGNAEVYGDAWVFGNAEVYGDAKVCGDAQVSGNAEVYGDARVFGNAEVYGDARVFNLRCLFTCNFTASFHITVTPQNAVIDCQLKTRAAWLKVTKEEAVTMGLAPELYEPFRNLLKIGMELVPEAKVQKCL